MSNPENLRVLSDSELVIVSGGHGGQTGGGYGSGWHAGGWRGTGGSDGLGWLRGIIGAVEGAASTLGIK